MQAAGRGQGRCWREAGPTSLHVGTGKARDGNLHLPRAICFNKHSMLYVVAKPSIHGQTRIAGTYHQHINLLGKH